MLERSAGRPVDPFMKWAGGKRWLFKRYRHLFPEKIKRLIDPFVGGGSSFFLLRPESAVLGDANEELIEIYECVRDRPLELAARLSVYHKQHSRELYYDVRARRPTDKLERAARLLYLNRTCWNGLFRVNLRGEFNVPIGTKTKVFLSQEEFVEPSISLARAKIYAADFGKLIDKASIGDVVFADPPYFDNFKKNERFLKYNKNTFSWDDQLRLFDKILAAHRRGAQCYVTNSNNKALIDIYRKHGVIRVLQRHSVLAGESWARKKSGEILIELR